MSNNLPSYLNISSNISIDLSKKIDQIRPDKYAFLVDENTKEHCLSILEVDRKYVIEIKSGEIHKTLNTCQEIWRALTDFGFTRKSLLINLGGGVIGDMGGFCAATYKRGIPFINIPTTLLSQVDASIGGKLGIDFNGLKNHLGMFQNPDGVIVDTQFLNTLSDRELRSGFAEIIKHSLIWSEDQWKYLLANSFHDMDWDEIIPKSIHVKSDVVAEDPKENGLRKILNYGHTIGHAIETHFLESSTPITHGEAVALGMILENDVAVKKGMLSQQNANQISDYIHSIYTFPEYIPNYEILLKNLIHDKKNDVKGLRFSLLDRIGHCTYDVLIENEILKEILK